MTLYIFNWQNDGLGRLRTEHLALPGQPFATESSPIRLGEAVRLKVSPQADRLDAVNPFIGYGAATASNAWSGRRRAMPS